MRDEPYSWGMAEAINLAGRRCPEVGGFEALAETGIDRLEKAARVILAPALSRHLPTSREGARRPAWPLAQSHARHVSPEHAVAMIEGILAFFADGK